MIYWYILKLINNTWIILAKSLSVSSSLNCFENSKNANLRAIGLSI